MTKSFLFLVGVLTFLGTSVNQAQMLEGLIHVASVRGEAHSSQKTLPLQKGDSFSGDENTITTGHDSFTVIVLSNGLSIYCGPHSKLTVQSFKQRPFDESSKDLEYETSRSELSLSLEEGTFGLSHRIPKPTSVFKLIIPQGTIEAQTQEFALSLQPSEARLYVFTESAQVKLKSRNKSELVQSDQWMDLLATSVMKTSDAVQRIHSPELRAYYPFVEMALEMRKRTLFVQAEDNTFKAHTIFQKSHFSRRALNSFTLRSE